MSAWIRRDLNFRASLPRIVNRNQYEIVVTDKYSKITRAIPTSRTSSSYVANVFFAFCVVPYGIPAYVPTENGVRLTKQAVCAALQDA